MQVKNCFRAFLLCVPLALGIGLNTSGTSAQNDADRGLKPDLHRALVSHANTEGVERKNAHQTLRRKGINEQRPRSFAADSSRRVPSATGFSVRALSANVQSPEALPHITPGTPLSRVLHTAQLTSLSGTDEQYVDRTGDLVADERTTLDSAGGFFDVAVGQSGARYGVFAGVISGTPVGALVVAVDTNGNYVSDSESTYNLKQYFDLPSAVAVVTGVSNSGREFVVVCSSGYYNAANPSDPYNEPSPGVILMVRDSSATGFDDSRARKLVTLGDNKLYNANALALLPNNDLLIADFHSDELRIVRDTDGDGMPDTLDATPYYSYRYSDDAPLDIAVNSRGIVFSHSIGDDTLMLALYDDNHDGRADRDEVIIEALSVDNNLLLHGLSVDRTGNIYVIEDASGAADSSSQGGNGGTPRVDAFPDQSQSGFPSDGAIFARADDPGSQALTGLAFGAVAPNQINQAQFFVRRHYLDFLSREPDDGGWDYWTTEITRCGNDPTCVDSRRIGVSGSFFVEQEFQKTGYVVYLFHRAAFGAWPNAANRANLTFSKFISDRSKLVGGSGLPQSTINFANTFVQRPEFIQAYPDAMTPTQFVTKLFDTANLMGPGNATLRQSAIDALTTNSKTRAQVLLDLIEIPELKTREYNPSFVTMQYFGYLRRNPEQEGYDFWLNVVNNREPNNYRGMICAFLTSREYQERFGLHLARSNADCGQ